MREETFEEKFMVQFLYSDDRQDSTHYLSRQELVKRFGKAYPFVHDPGFEQATVIIGVEGVKIVKLP